MNIKQVLYLLLSFLTLITGYAFLRYAYNVTDSLPFTQEIVLIILGTVATIFITSLLLNKQTSVEVEKEQNIKFLELKTKTYERLLDLLEEMSLVETFSNTKLVHLSFITHRLALVASHEVLEEYQNFLQVMQNISKDNTFKGDAIALHDALSALTLTIRDDLLGHTRNIQYSKQRLDEVIKLNSHQSSEIRKGS